MALYDNLQSARANLDRPVVAIGNFDGVHHGHRSLLRLAQTLASDAGTSSAVLTFEPHPVRFFRPNLPPFRLTTNEQRHELITRQGVDGVVAIPFNKELSSLSPAEFIDEILLEGLNASAILVGEGFRFGAKRAGTTEVLRNLCDERGIEVHIITPIEGEGEVVSSTRIRDAITQVDFRTAERLLGHRYALAGDVVHGDARGRHLGFPTANVAVENELSPPHGIYATFLIDPEFGRLPSASYIGGRPTFDGAGYSVESFVLDREDLNLYGHHVQLEFVEQIRPDQKFASADELIEQMKKDVDRARQILAEQRR